MDELRERLAALEHERWAHWMRYYKARRGQQGIVQLSIDWERWTRQMNAPYADLSEKEKDSDREWADKALAILKEYLEGKVNITISGQGSEIGLLARIVELERVIRMVPEWCEGGMQFRCLWCKRTPIPGHAPDCPRQALGLDKP